MPVDSSIALQLKPIQLDNPLDIQAKGLTLRHLQQQTDQADREIQSQRTLADLYRSNIKPDGTIEDAGLIKGIAGSGYGEKIPAYQKQLLEAKKAGIDITNTQATTAKTLQDTEKSKLELMKQRLDRAQSELSSLAANPNVSVNDVAKSFRTMVSQGFMTNEEAIAGMKDLPQDPSQLRPYLIQKGLHVMDANKRLELMLPKPYETNLGGQVEQGNIDQMTGVRTPSRTIQKTQDPNSLAAQLAPKVFHNSNGTATVVPYQGQPQQPIPGVSILQGGGDIAPNPFTAQQGSVSPIVPPIIGGKQNVAPPERSQPRQEAYIVGTPMEKPLSQAQLKAEQAKRDEQKSNNETLSLMQQAKGYLNGATGSVAGNLIDEAVNSVGGSTSGAKKIAQLKTVEGKLVSSIKKLGGSTSDADRKFYIQQLGSLGDPRVAVDTKLAAIKAVEEHIRSKQAGQSTSSSASSGKDQADEVLRKLGIK